METVKTVCIVPYRAYWLFSIIGHWRLVLAGYAICAVAIGVNRELMSTQTPAAGVGSKLVQCRADRPSTEPARSQHSYSGKHLYQRW